MMTCREEYFLLRASVYHICILMSMSCYVSHLIKGCRAPVSSPGDKSALRAGGGGGLVGSLVGGI